VLGFSLSLGSLWLSAEVAIGEKNLQTARRLLERIEAIQTKSSRMLDLAYVGLRLARVLLLLRDSESLGQLNVRMCLLLELLGRHPFAQAALMDFNRLVIDRRLSTKNLERLTIELALRGRAAP